MLLAGLILGSLSAGTLMALPARAADAALLEVIGYSDTHRYFAFEQYGIQDGSGFPYSEIFLIDLASDSYVGGAPFRARIETGGADLAQARAMARSRAEDALAEYGVDQPARIVALRGDGEWGGAGEDTALAFGLPGYGLSDPVGSYRIALDLFRAPSTLDCADWFGEPPMGFALTLDDGSGPVELHRDRRVPASRNCAITYKAYGVVMPLWSRDIADGVALLSVHAHGFEGADRRFVAFPLGHTD